MMTDKKKDKKTFLILTITAYVVLAALLIYRVQQSSETCPFVSPDKTGTAADNKITASAADTARKKLPSLLELGSKSCVPCQMMEPVLAKLKKEYAGTVNVSFIDVWLKENIDLGKKYKINSIPVQIFFDAQGNELWRHTGYISEKDILEKWKSLGYDLVALKKTKK